MIDEKRNEIKPNYMKAVLPAPGFSRDRVAGVQKCIFSLDSGVRRNDEGIPFFDLHRRCFFLLS
jgi:hypothetical protein